MTTRTKHRYINLDVQRKIEDLVDLGATPKQIENELHRTGEFKGRIPTLRTIQRMHKELSPDDLSMEWTLADGEPDDAHLILDVLAFVAEGAVGAKKHLTRNEADWVIRIRRVAPELPPWAVWPLVRAYMLRESKGKLSPQLEYFLAFRPWRSKHDMERYEKAIAANMDVTDRRLLELAKFLLKEKPSQEMPTPSGPTPSELMPVLGKLVETIGEY